jgi:hypothetical protein
MPKFIDGAGSAIRPAARVRAVKPATLYGVITTQSVQSKVRDVDPLRIG